MSKGGAQTVDEPQWWWWALVAPCFLGLVGFTYIPSLASFLLGFADWNLLGAPSWVGLANYSQLLQSELFWQVVGNTSFFVIWVVVLELALGLLLASGLYWLPKARAALSTLLFLPYVTPMVAVALVFGWLYQPENGWLNQLGHAVGLLENPVAWLYNPDTVLPSVIALEVWKMVGYNTLLLLAGLQAVPPSLLEAASLDGANRFQQWWRVLLPVLTPTLFFVGILTVIHALQAFDSVYLLTQGGPQHASALVVYWVYKQAFEWFQVGNASAMAYGLFLVIALLTLLQWRLRKRWVLNE